MELGQYSFALIRLHHVTSFFKRNKSQIIQFWRQDITSHTSENKARNVTAV